MTAPAIDALKTLGYDVTPSKSQPGRYRWWRSTGSDGESVPEQELSEMTFDSALAAWQDAQADALLLFPTDSEIVISTRPTYADPALGWATTLRAMGKGYRVSFSSEPFGRVAVSIESEYGRLELRQASNTYEKTELKQLSLAQHAILHDVRRAGLVLE